MASGEDQTAYSSAEFEESNGGHASNNEAKKPFTPHDVYRVGVRLPPFWPEEPSVWFAQIEGNFMMSGIKDDNTKFYYVAAQLEQRYAAEVKDIICNPPKTGKYEKLKTELVKRLSASREKELKQLLMFEELGDKRPSQFLRHLQHLAGPNVPEDFVKTIWTSRLPNNIQTCVACQPNTDLETLAVLADRVFDIAPSTPQVAAASTTSESMTQMEKMSMQIAELTRQVHALTSRGSSSRRPRSRNRKTQKTDRSGERSQSSYQKHPVCWYHYKFGDKADRCQPPCDFKQGNAHGSR